jgi:hypothetical protein
MSAEKMVERREKKMDIKMVGKMGKRKAAKTVYETVVLLGYEKVA